MAPSTRNSARVQAAQARAAPKASAKTSPKSETKGTRSRQSKSTATKRKATAHRLGQPKKPRVESKAPANSINFQIPVGRKHPPWATLPYEILLSIFQFAAYPLIDEHWNRTPAVKWLVGTSVVCKSFLEPVLATLYHGPPLIYQQEYAIFSQLMMSDKLRSIDYRSKVHSLDFEVNHTKFATFAGELGDLIRRLPALKAVGLHQTADYPQPMNVSRPHTTRAELIYHGSWINSLASVHLTRFKMHSMFLNTHQPAARFEHWAFRPDGINPSFKSLEKLEIASFIDISRGERRLAAALQALPSLRRLSFLRCDFNGDGEIPEDDILIFHLPKTLTSLEFVSCFELTTENVSRTLRTSGQALRTLTLRSNRDTSLSFLTTLAEYCPRLEKLEYDLVLYSTSLVLHHADPFFDALMRPGEVPSWPATLQSLDLNQLRRWDAKTAETFFNSLRDSAAELPDLRRISIAASVDAGWRERVTFRERIIAPLIEMFQRNTQPVDTAPASRKVPARQGSRARNQEAPVHGKCDQVYIRVDNLRPAEEQLTESNFLDSEQSGDENYVE